MSSERLHNWSETATRLGGLSRTTVFALWKAGELGSVTIGSRRFSSDQQIRTYIARLESAQA
ncbi:uncharacterized protein RMCC_5164 [Mycolicibacterium canariasense]|uniref:Helix-turn-helix domain-containing protein n=1 Tax=Mycolicibacterium canariasense TaxID=228230 RepID=A0A100WHW2_MYCCR|nr:hypothetical protein [Mycolicibacterium canariasense]GAS98199.1 uncharacterized protein RMCC_5164 [Mycolicibacterium canariasense]